MAWNPAGTSGLGDLRRQRERVRLARLGALRAGAFFAAAVFLAGLAFFRAGAALALLAG
jgi:hypothetical protein